MSVTIIPPREGQNSSWLVQFDRENPPDVFFDTNVWIGMRTDDVNTPPALAGGVFTKVLFQCADVFKQNHLHQ